MLSVLSRIRRVMASVTERYQGVLHKLNCHNGLDGFEFNVTILIVQRGMASSESVRAI